MSQENKRTERVTSAYVNPFDDLDDDWVEQQLAMSSNQEDIFSKLLDLDEPEETESVSVVSHKSNGNEPINQSGLGASIEAVTMDDDNSIRDIDVCYTKQKIINLSSQSRRVFSVRHDERTELSLEEVEEYQQKGLTENDITDLLALGANKLVLDILTRDEKQNNLSNSESIDTIKQCVLMGEKAAYDALGKDLIFVVGTTGCGKSTAINALLGCDMEIALVNNERVVHVKADSKLPEVMAIGHTQHSKTFIPQIGVGVNQNLMFCDAPGLFENRGAEISIANIINLSHMIENAKSVRFLILVNYHDIKPIRSPIINKLNNSFEHFFGNNWSQQYAHNLIIGITQVPDSVDLDCVTIKAKSRLKLQDNLCPKIMVIDPLDKRVDDGCSRSDWLDSLNDLTKLSASSDLFKKQLSDSDRLMLLEMSNDISKQLSVTITENKLEQSFNLLDSMRKLASINEPEINKHHSEMITLLKELFVRKSENIFKLCDLNDFSKAHDEIEVFIASMQLFAQFENSLLELAHKVGDHYQVARFQYQCELVRKTIKKFEKMFYQEGESRRLIAPVIHEKIADQFGKEWTVDDLNLSMNDLLTIFETVSPIQHETTSVLGQLKKLQKIAQLFDMSDLYVDFEWNNRTAFIEVAEHARIHTIQQINEQLTTENIKARDIAAQCVQNHDAWNDSGKCILQCLRPLERDTNPRNVISVLENVNSTELTEKSFTELMSKLCTVIDLPITSEHQLRVQDVFDSVVDQLITLKECLLKAERSEIEQLQKEQDQINADKFISSTIGILSLDAKHEKFDYRKQQNQIFLAFSELSESQMTLVKNSELISRHIIDNCKECLQVLEQKITWEKNGSLFLKVTMDLVNINEVNDLLPLLLSLSKLDECGYLFSTIHYLVTFSVVAQEKLALNISELVSHTQSMFLKIRSRFNEQSHIEQQEKMRLRQIEADKLVAIINNDLLPKYRFKEVNAVMDQLHNIDPERIKMIGVKAMIMQLQETMTSALTNDDVKLAVEMLDVCVKAHSDISEKFKEQLELSIDTKALIKKFDRHLDDLLTKSLQDITDLISKDTLCINMEDLPNIDSIKQFLLVTRQLSGAHHSKNWKELFFSQCEKIVDSAMVLNKNLPQESIIRLLLTLTHLCNEISTDGSEFVTKMKADIDTFLNQLNTNIVTQISLALPIKMKQCVRLSGLVGQLISNPIFAVARNKLFFDSTNKRPVEDLVKEMLVPDPNALLSCYQMYVSYFDKLQSEIEHLYEPTHAVQDYSCSSVPSDQSSIIEQGQDDRRFERLSSTDQQEKKLEPAKQSNDDKKYILDLFGDLPVDVDGIPGLTNTIEIDSEKHVDEQFLKKIVTQTIALGRELEGVENYFHRGDIIAQMLANIFGIWCYLDAERSGFRIKKSYLWSAHASQVLAVLSLLGVDNDEPLSNHLQQVNTGEGKSILSVAASIMLALMGYHVDVVCYSPYLAGRDESAFAKLIDTLKLQDMVKYRTIDQAVEHYISTEIGDLRTSLLQLLSGKECQLATLQKKKRILFIDEVDVFFHEHFLARTYNPTVLITNNEYVELLIEIWKSRDRYLSMAKDSFISHVQKQPGMQPLLTAYPNLKPLLPVVLDELRVALRVMSITSDIGSRNSPVKNYVIENDKIAYRDEFSGSVDSKVNYSSCTSFAYIKEYLAGNITKLSAYERIGINITAGQLTFSKIPCLYDHLFGATATLSALTQFEQSEMTRYKIDRQTIIPSIYDKQPLIGAENVRVYGGKRDAEGENSYFYNIKKSVEERLLDDQAVIVVFETAELLEQYSDFILKQPYQLKNYKSNKLMSSTRPVDRDVMIQSAARLYTVTQVERAYGRGSDFTCFDSDIKRKGVHVICSFFPETYAEEIQIKGRTRRLNDPGSFEFILSLNDLGKYLINNMSETAQSDQSPYQILSERREQLQAKKQNALQQCMQDMEERHNNTLELAKLYNSNTKALGLFGIFGDADKKLNGATTKAALGRIEKFFMPKI